MANKHMCIFSILKTRGDRCISSFRQLQNLHLHTCASENKYPRCIQMMSSWIVETLDLFCLIASWLNLWLARSVHRLLRQRASLQKLRFSILRCRSSSILQTRGRFLERVEVTRDTCPSPQVPGDKIVVNPQLSYYEVMYLDQDLMILSLR